MMRYPIQYLIVRVLPAFLVWCSWLTFVSPNILSASTDPEQLIIFVQTGASDVDSTFQDQYLPELRKMAEKMGVEIRVVDVRKGVPSDVAITPMIVYQNFRGRSIYQGRTTTLKRIRNFIRTSRFVPQGETPYFRENIPIWNYHQAQIWAPLKVAPVTGIVPDTYNHRTFVKEARTSIAKGFKSFQIKERVELGRSDRGFYMDFYPWLSEDGTLFLSLALFSQFHCKKPVFEKKDDPLTGPWKERNALFTRAAMIMEDAVQTCIQEPEGGDGFDIVPPDIPLVSWKDLGFPLPQAPEEKTVDAPIDMEVPRVWVVANPGIDEPPLIQFRFSAPLDNYSGEVTRARGEIYLSQSPTLIGTTSFVETDPLSVTMGESQLDQTIQGNLFLYSKKYPKAKFVIAKVSADGQPLGYGRLSLVSVSGIFTLKGKSFPLTLNTEIEPVIGEKGKPLLLARGSFQIDLRDFDIEGAEGPAPAKYTLEFEINLRMHAKE